MLTSAPLSRECVRLERERACSCACVLECKVGSEWERERERERERARSKCRVWKKAKILASKFVDQWQPIDRTQQLSQKDGRCVFPGRGKINKSLNFEFASKPDSFTDNKNDRKVLLKEGPVICVNDDSDEGVVCVIFRRRCRDAFRRLLEPTLALQRRRRRWRRRPGSEPAAHRRRLWRLRTGTLSGQTEIKVWTLERESYRYFRNIIEA